jgi:hypothetical protein
MPIGTPERQRARTTARWRFAEGCEEALEEDAEAERGERAERDTR